MFRLRCADRTVWQQIISFYPDTDLSIMAPHCRVEMCGENMRCARNCLEHVLEVAREKER